MSVSMVKEKIKNLFIRIKTSIMCAVFDNLPLESIENIIVKHRQEDDNNKIAVFHIEWTLQSHTINFVKNVAGIGLNVDLFLYKASQHLVDMSQINNNSKIKIYDMSNFSDNENIYEKYSKLFRGKYLYFIGIEKRGIITAGKLSDRFYVPTIYYCLELYSEDHEQYEPNNWIGIRRNDEIKYHSKAYATIIQDRFRAEKLFSYNKVEKKLSRMLYLPISVSGGKNTNKCKYLHEKLGIDVTKRILLYFGLIRENRYSVELAKISAGLPDNTVMVFHGYYESEQEKLKVEKYSNDKLFVSREIVDQKSIQRIISSADIGLVFYDNKCINERLTAFSSEKIALFMQSGVPIITFNNETYSELYAKYKCGLAIDSIEMLNSATTEIFRNYPEYRDNAYKAFEEYYDYENNFNKIKYIFDEQESLECNA